MASRASALPRLCGMLGSDNGGAPASRVRHVMHSPHPPTTAHRSSPLPHMVVPERALFFFLCALLCEFVGRVRFFFVFSMSGRVAEVPVCLHEAALTFDFSIETSGIPNHTPRRTQTPQSTNSTTRRSGREGGATFTGRRRSGYTPRGQGASRPRTARVRRWQPP